MENDERIIAQLIGHLDEAIVICDQILEKLNDQNSDPDGSNVTAD